MQISRVDKVEYAYFKRSQIIIGSLFVIYRSICQRPSSLNFHRRRPTFPGYCQTLKGCSESKKNWALGFIQKRHNIDCRDRAQANSNSIRKPAVTEDISVPKKANTCSKKSKESVPIHLLTYNYYVEVFVDVCICQFA